MGWLEFNKSKPGKPTGKQKHSNYALVLLKMPSHWGRRVAGIDEVHIQRAPSGMGTHIFLFQNRTCHAMLDDLFISPGNGATRILAFKAELIGFNSPLLLPCFPRGDEDKGDDL